MTILFMGGDMSSVETTTGFSSDITSVVYRGPVPFTGLGIRTSSSGGSEYSEPEAWSPVSEIWVHFITWVGSSENIYLMNGTDVAFKLHKVGGTHRISYLSAPGTYTQIGTSFTLDNEWNYYDLHIVTGASGSATLYFNNVERMPTASADMSYAGDISGFRLPSTGGVSNDVGGIVVADEPTIGWRLGRLVPASNGASTSWTGDYASVDETALSVTDYIYSGSADQVETYAITTSPDAFTGYVPRAVAVSAYARRGASGPTGLQLALRSGSTNYFSSTKSLGLGYTGNLAIWETNPDTSADWTSSQLAALQIGVKSIA